MNDIRKKEEKFIEKSPLLGMSSPSSNCNVISLCLSDSLLSKIRVEH